MKVALDADMNRLMEDARQEIVSNYRRFAVHENEPDAKDYLQLEDQIVEAAKYDYKKQYGKPFRGVLTDSIHKDLLLSLWKEEPGSKPEKIVKPRREGFNHIKKIYYGSAFLNLPEEARDLFNPVERMVLYDGVARFKAQPSKYIPRRTSSGLRTEKLFDMPVYLQLYELASTAFEKSAQKAREIGNVGYEILEKAYGIDAMELFDLKVQALSEECQEGIGHNLQRPNANYEMHRIKGGREVPVMQGITDIYQKDRWTNVGGLKVPSKRLIGNYIDLITSMDP
ncbi:MAG: hypothetical protein ACLFP2_05775 [Candidatus Woesearchaeota archaeon]